MRRNRILMVGSLKSHSLTKLSSDASGNCSCAPFICALLANLANFGAC